MKSWLTKPSNVLPFYTSSQKSTCSKEILIPHTVMLWLICRHRYFGLGFCTYMKVILIKNLTFIAIIIHSSNLRKCLELWKKCNFLNFCVFYVLKKGLKSANFTRIQTFCKLKLCMVNNIEKSKVFC